MGVLVAGEELLLLVLLFPSMSQHLFWPLVSMILVIPVPAISFLPDTADEHMWHSHTLSPKLITGYKFLLIKDCYETDQFS